MENLFNTENYGAYMDVSKVTLDRLQRITAGKIDGHALHSMRLNVDKKELTGDMIIRLGYELLAETVDGKQVNEEISVVAPVNFRGEVYFKTPATWWQHFKYDHFPEWLSKRFPVKMVTRKRGIGQETYVRVKCKVKAEVKAAYPKLPQVYPECGPVQIVGISRLKSEEIKGVADIVVERE